MGRKPPRKFRKFGNGGTEMSTCAQFMHRIALQKSVLLNTEFWNWQDEIFWAFAPQLTVSLSYLHTLIKRNQLTIYRNYIQYFALAWERNLRLTTTKLDMLPIPHDVLARFDAALEQRNVPAAARTEYRKWLRYFLDFRAKYPLPESKAEQVRLFVEKLRSKKQTIKQQEQAADAVSLFFAYRRGINPFLRQPPNRRLPPHLRSGVGRMRMRPRRRMQTPWSANRRRLLRPACRMSEGANAMTNGVA